DRPQVLVRNPMSMKMPNCTQFVVVSVLATCSLVTPCHAGSREPDSQTVDRAHARELLQQGIAAIESGSFESARQTLLEAWKLQRSYDVAGALGQAELELKRNRDAAEHLDYSIRDFPPSES